MFLRPTESLTVFLQQLGRGLRKAEKKDYLTVLDFVGNARPEYDFERKFRALVGKTNTTIEKEVEDDFPHLPVGCSIVLERKAKETILQNIKAATGYSHKKLVSLIKQFVRDHHAPLTLQRFVEYRNIPLAKIYSKRCWSRLCMDAGVVESQPLFRESEITRAIQKKWLQCTGNKYFEFILKCAHQNFDIDPGLLHYDVWQEEGGFASLKESIVSIGKDKALVLEIIEVISLLADRIDFVERPIDLRYSMPLRIYSRYSKDQICAAFGFHTFEKKGTSREGVINLPDKNSELLFITLEKSEKEYSPTTMYDDYAINERLFHWQSQNSARPDKGAGMGYTHQKQTGKKILLFVRERADDEYGNTMGYIFLGDADYVGHTGQKPMNITWELREPIPAYIWKDTAKMSVS
jgi:hypothetical protein